MQIVLPGASFRRCISAITANRRMFACSTKFGREVRLSAFNSRENVDEAIERTRSAFAG